MYTRGEMRERNSAADLIVNFAPTGMIPTRAMTPHVPILVQEIVDDVRRCAQVGISMVHLHARDGEGNPTQDAGIYGRLIGGIREFAPELVLCVSLSGRLIQEYDKRAEPLGLKGDLKPDMASLTLGSMNFPRQASMNSPDTVKAFAMEMWGKGIVPELEIFDLGMANYAKYLIGKGLLEPPFYANLFLGSIAGAQIDLVHAGLLVRDLPEKTLWSMAGVGDAQLAAHALGIATGGGVRVGLEDSIYMDSERTVLATNEAMVGRVHRMAAEFGRKAMSPKALRALLGLKKEGFGR